MLELYPIAAVPKCPMESKFQLRSTQTNFVLQAAPSYPEIDRQAVCGPLPQKVLRQ